MDIIEEQKTFNFVVILHLANNNKDFVAYSRLHLAPHKKFVFVPKVTKTSYIEFIDTIQLTNSNKILLIV